MLDVKRLRVFLVVAEESSITAAAHRLYLTQSAVSQQIAALERDLGVVLFRRVARGMQVTEAGAVLLGRARELLASIASIEHDMRELGSGAEELRLGAFTTVGIELLPQALRTFAERHPNVRVRLTTVILPADPRSLLLDQNVHALLDFDYNFDPRPVEPPLTRLHLLDDPLQVVVPAGHPLAGQEQIALTDLAAEPWVLHSHAAPYEHVYERMCAAAGFEPNVVFRANDYQSLLGLVAAGMGVTLAPWLSTRWHRADVCVRSTGAPELIRRVGVLTLHDVRPASPLADLIAVLRSTAEQVGRDSQ